MVYTKSRKLKSSNQAPLEKLRSKYEKWLFLTKGDIEAIDVVLACVIDRDIGGDPVWLFVIAPSGGTKTEVIRSLNEYHKVFPLSWLTKNTLISGKTISVGKGDKKKTVIVQGLLRKLDQKVLVIKDFTVILSMPHVDRNEILAQLRDIYDGACRKAFGNLIEPICIEATIGFITGVTPAIDKYQKVTTTLGERFLKVRLHPDIKKATEKASENCGKEEEMREELRREVNAFLSNLDFSKIPKITKTQRDEIIKMARYIAKMRAYVFAKLNYRGEIVEMDMPEAEIPTRVSKQLSKLAIALASVRGHNNVTEDDMNTLKRVARDTALPKRQEMVKVMWENPLEIAFTKAELADYTRLHYNTAKREIEKMESLGILETKIRGDNDHPDTYRFTDEFRELAEVVNSG